MQAARNMEHREIGPPRHHHASRSWRRYSAARPSRSIASRAEERGPLRAGCTKDPSPARLRRSISSQDMRSLKIIINADDLGYSSQVNAQIFDLMTEGRISSATLLTGGKYFADACKDLVHFPRCSFGVHLYLTSLSPQTNKEVFAANGLLSDDGHFNNAIRRTPPSRELKEAIYAEWCAQLDRAKDFNVPVSHIDSHHHVHTIPWLFLTLCKLARRYRIPAIRRSMDLYLNSEVSPPTSLLAKKAVWNCALQALSAAKTTRHFTNLRWFWHLIKSPQGRDLQGSYRTYVPSWRPNIRRRNRAIECGLA